ncbi:hypothetical protein GDO86_013974 [Hymenochirus boettgeri]|uniref:Otopetrin 3 n=1 Tax=Hymenochirus boettgeri TaxID=247094 RepID=A0A8T2JV35_9PIPI|nr:hypothetical protein GDO86_013974 [Hymenochirus boettgeri]
MINYEYSWLHRHCTIAPIHHKRAQKTGRLFSGLFALNLMFLGAAMSSSVVLSQGSVPERDSQIFITVLMFFSSMWTLIHLLYVRKQKDAVLLHDHHAGALWLQASLTLFGLCSILLSIFKIGHVVHLLQCRFPMDIIFSSMEIVFVSLQTILLWVCSKECIQVYHRLTRYGIMLTLSTNMVLWLTGVIDDSLERDLESLQSNSTQEERDLRIGCQCPEYSPCWTFKKGFVTMYPFNLEYCLICASMLFVMWKNVGRKEHSQAKPTHTKFRLRYVVYGPLLGGAVLLVGIFIFVQYQIQASSGVVLPSSFQIYYGYMITILTFMITCSIMGIITYSQREKERKRRSENKSEEEESENRSQGWAYRIKYRRRHLETIQEENRNGRQGEGHTEESAGHDHHCQEHMEGPRNAEQNFYVQGQQAHPTQHSEGHEQQVECSPGQVERDRYSQGQHQKIDYNQEQDQQLGHIQGQVRKTDNTLEEGIKMEDTHTVVDVAGHRHIEHNNSEMQVGNQEQTDHHYIQREARTMPSLGVNVPKKPKNQGSRTKNYTRRLDVVLLLTCVPGQFCISYFSIIAIVVTNRWDTVNILSFLHSLFLVLQYVFQTMFIIEGMSGIHEENKGNSEPLDNPPRRMSLQEIRRVSIAYLQEVGRLSVSRRAVKETAMFLVLCNVMCWIMSAFGAHPFYMNGLERQFYGSSTWLAILNVGLPMSVFYRMHSVGSLLEVYLNA